MTWARSIWQIIRIINNDKMPLGTTRTSLGERGRCPIVVRKRQVAGGGTDYRNLFGYSDSRLSAPVPSLLYSSQPSLDVWTLQPIILALFCSHFDRWLLVFLLVYLMYNLTIITSNELEMICAQWWWRSNISISVNIQTQTQKMGITGRCSHYFQRSKLDYWQWKQKKIISYHSGSDRNKSS